MGSGSTTPAKRDEKHTLGLKPERTNNAETGKVLPWFAGQGRFGLTWLGPAYNQTTEGVTGEDSGGKGSNGDEVTAYDYYADCAGVVCLGLVDKLREIWMDQERVWRGTLERDSVHPNFASIDIEGRGTMHIYWGTETQTAHTTLAANGHPAYRGQCYVFFEQLYFGRDKTNAPDVELVLERSPLNYTGAVAISGVKRRVYDASLIHSLVELLSHPRAGFGFTSVDFDLPQLAAVGASLLAEGIAASPSYDDQETAQTVVETFCEYIGGYPSFRDGNKLRILLEREPDVAATAYPLIGEFDLTKTPRYSTESMRETVNKVVVKFMDWTRYFEPDSETWVDVGNYAVTGRWAPQTLDRPWITVRAIAVKVARRHARLSSVPLISAELTVRRDLVDDELGRRADELKPGGFIRFTYANYNETLLMRIKKVVVASDRSQSVKLWVESDLYQDAVLGYTADDPPGPDDDLGVDPGGALNWQIVELPAALVADDAGAQNITVPWFGVFAARSSALDTRLAVYASDDGAAYKRVVLQKSGLWAVFGTLDAALTLTPSVDTAADLLIRIPAGQADFRPKSATPGDNAALWRGDYLLYVGGEWIAYREAYASVDALTGDRLVNLHGIVRHRFGAVIAEHAAGAGCWMIRRADLKAYTNKAFRLSSEPLDNDVWFKVTTGTKTTWYPVGDVAAVSLNIKGVTPMPVPPVNMRFNASSIHTVAQGATAGAGFTWDTTTDVILAVLWEDRAWQRNAFFAAWLKPFRGEQSYVTVVRPLGWVDGDPEYVLPKLTYPADAWTGFAGTRAAAITVADIVAELGSLPDVFSVTVVAVWRGIESLPVTGWVVVSGTAGVAPTIDLAQPFQWSPSGLYVLAYTADPEVATNANFEALATHWSIGFGTGSTIKPLVGLKPKTAKARLVANFAALQTWVRANISGQSGFTLFTLTASEPEWVIDANFELLNALW